jgi:hypothetical protein
MKKKKRDQPIRLNPSLKHSHRTPVRDGGRNGTISDRRPLPIHFITLKCYFFCLFNLLIEGGLILYGGGASSPRLPNGYS